MLRVRVGFQDRGQRRHRDAALRPGEFNLPLGADYDRPFPFLRETEIQRVQYGMVCPVAQAVQFSLDATENTTLVSRSKLFHVFEDDTIRPLGSEKAQQLEEH